MNKIKKYQVKANELLLMSLALLLLFSCDDFLDKKPIDYITPEIYFSNVDELASYSIRRYQDSDFKSNNKASYSLGVFKNDNDTDIQLSSGGSRTRWVDGVWTVPVNDGGWKFDQIYAINYFFEKVMPKYNENEISGSKSEIEHYIGEMYMLRAVEYFKLMKQFGDFPILKNTISSADVQLLIDANQRRPMNEVGRFIISDLDSAAYYMHAGAPDDNGNRNRLTRDASILLKSRVGLYVGSWLQNFKNTPFVPNGLGWNGKDKDYNNELQIDIDREIDFFLTSCMESSKIIADNIPLVDNLKNDYSESNNPYVLMFTDEDLSIYPEVIFWNATSKETTPTGYGFAHAQGGNNTGYTKAYIDSFLDRDGLPIYRSSTYLGDETLANVKKDRDDRLVQFLKIKDEAFSVTSDNEIILTPEPTILKSSEYKSTTGYDVKKGLTMSVDDKMAQNQVSGIIEYRAVEAYLNYIEASYIKNGFIDNVASQYWKSIRKRAGVNEDYNKTIAATDMEQEKSILSAFTAGGLVDATMYNIRRERACELMSEGFRWDDLRRWRSMDQLIDQKYIPEGFKLWGTMKGWYDNESGQSLLKYVGDNQGSSQGNVSSPQLSVYFRPYQIIESNDLYDGYSWEMAHYLSPIGMSQFNITSISEGVIDYSKSPLYQNPGWPIQAGGKATDIRME